ncbi:MAG: hypothetical protein KBD17_00755 [Candidatus Pacebacteria bacterium]|nr:hypothetical protein [Candidatus Paceibacterota bacterium]
MSEHGVLLVSVGVHTTPEAFLDALGHFHLNPAAGIILRSAASGYLSRSPFQVEVATQTVHELTGDNAPPCSKVLEALELVNGLVPLEFVLALRERMGQNSEEFMYAGSRLEGYAPVLFRICNGRSELVLHTIDSPGYKIQGDHIVILGQ